MKPSPTFTIELYENGYSAISNKEVSETINDYLIKAMRTMINLAAPISSQQFSIPTSLVAESADEAVNFKGLSMMVMVQGFDWFTKNPINSFTISNTQMTETSNIYCYISNEGKYYTNKKVNIDGWELKKIVKNIYTAAKNGYYPHPVYFN